MKTLLTLLGLLPIMATAQSLSSEQAQQQAYDFFRSHVPAGAHHAPAAVSPVLAYTAQTEGTPDFYVFNRSAEAPGFVIINSDASAPQPILGYGDNAAFDYEAIPDNLRWWLSQYQQNGVAKLPAKASAGRHDVEPLVNAKWGQGDPYNRLVCQSNGYNFVTGCTSTAMSQIMYKHRWPNQGRGTHSYTNEYSGGLALPQYADFAGTTYDWTNMLDDYSHGFTAAQANAVATLMYHAGVSENTYYNGNASSADDRNSGKGLIEHFRYDRNMRHGQREYYTDQEWDEILYNELAAGRPVMYSGQDGPDLRTSNGHSFVCDGYRASDGLFSFNWGWDGNYNGYFAITGAGALKPNGTGTGGSGADASYSYYQSINYNIRPDEGGDYYYHVGNYTEGRLSTSVNGTALEVYNVGTSGDRTLYYTYQPLNVGFHDVQIEYGVMLRNVATGVAYVDEAHAGSTNNLQSRKLTPGAFYSVPFAMAFDTDLVPCNGNYEVLPAYRPLGSSGPWSEAMHLISNDDRHDVPVVIVSGKADAEPVALPFTVTANVVQVGKTVTITHTPFYTGSVTYTSSDPAVATVSAEGIVTGVGVGTATIRIHAGGDANYLATDEAIEIEVVEHVYRDVSISLANTVMTVGDEAKVSITEGYDGTPVYVSSNPSVATVSADGTILALAEGEATISVTCPATRDYREASASFIVSVSDQLVTPAAFCFSDYPTMGDNNICTSTDIVLHMPIFNNTGKSMSPCQWVYELHFDGGSQRFSYGFNNVPNGHKLMVSVNFSGSSAYFTPGRVYSVEFYQADGETPMNVSSIKFLYVGNDPVSAGSLTSVISSAGEGEAPLKLIRSVVNKILKK